MMPRRHLSFLVLLAPLCLTACGAADDRSGAPQEQDLEGRGDSRGDLRLRGADDGALASVVQGKSVIVEVDAMPSTGFYWVINREDTDEAFGTADERWIPEEPDSLSGVTRLTWGKLATARTGRHHVSLHYTHLGEIRRPEPLSTFSFSVDVVTNDAAQVLHVTAEDDGVIALPRSGQDLVLSLPASPTTGYDWAVVSTDKTFGYPKTTFEASNDTVGSEGTDVMTWKTTSPRDLTGDHHVLLAYQRGDEAPERNFEFTVRIAP